jgi:hypothetical protein
LPRTLIVCDVWKRPTTDDNLCLRYKTFFFVMYIGKTAYEQTIQLILAQKRVFKLLGLFAIDANKLSPFS